MDTGFIKELLKMKVGLIVMSLGLGLFTTFGFSSRRFWNAEKVIEGKEESSTSSGRRGYMYYRSYSGFHHK